MRAVDSRLGVTPTPYESIRPVESGNRDWTFGPGNNDIGTEHAGNELQLLRLNDERAVPGDCGSLRAGAHYFDLERIAADTFRGATILPSRFAFPYLPSSD